MKTYRIAGLAAASLGLSLWAAHSLAGPIPVAPPSPPGTQLFVSPAGQPFRAPPGQPYPVGAWFAAADANQDGKIDKAELRADAAAFFKVLDQDHDGAVDGFEVTNYERRIVPEILQNQTFGALTAPRFVAPSLIVRAQRYGQDPADMAPVTEEDISDRTKGHKKQTVSLQGAAPYTFLREPEPVSASDADFNHRISPEEFTAASDRRFKLLDKDGDGVLTLATLPMTAWQAAQKGR